jgi:hydrogenase expression/formation protein HypE
VSIVTGDTKTVDHGSADGIFINTAGIGIKLPNVELGLGRIEVGDKILINGTIGDHGMTIVSQREGISFESPLASDCAGLAELTCTLFESVRGIKFMRDPTRGGLAATLNEIVEGSRRSVEIEEKEVPVKPTVQTAADMLGFDVLNAANEGKFVAVVSSDTAQECLRICREHPLGAEARIIGEVVEMRDAPLVWAGIAEDLLMHETVVAQSLVEIIAQEAQDRHARPIRAKMSCGELNEINDEVLSFAFEALAQGTPCAGMTLEIEHKALQAKCGTH